MFKDMVKYNIRADDLFLNADGIIADDELYAERYSIERTNAWIDGFRTIPKLFGTTLSICTSWNHLAFAILLLKNNSRKQKVQIISLFKE